MAEMNITPEIIAEQMRAIGLECRIEEIAGREAVVYDYPDEPGLPEDCNVTIEQLSEDTKGISILVTVFSGLGKQQTENAAKVIGHFNRFLRVGSFSVISDGAVFLSHTFLLDGELQPVNTLAAFFATLDAVSSAAAEGRQQLLPLINGELTCEQLTEQGIFVDQ